MKITSGKSTSYTGKSAVRSRRGYQVFQRIIAKIFVVYIRREYIMSTAFTNVFVPLWKKYFPGVDLPITYYYANLAREEDLAETLNLERCLIGNLKRVQDGYSFVYDAHTPGCSGGKRYTGFSKTLSPKFKYFLSCGIPGELEGERYKKSPQLVKQYIENHPAFEAPGKYLVFKRLDKLAQDEKPLAVIFFATPDVLSSLFTLANYDWADPYGVICPMGSGCSSIINHPYLESQSENPRCILGMFDVSTRPYAQEGKLTFTIPMQRFEQMVANMEESFLITHSWDLDESDYP
jgi:uncharacterized protein (DUF169 family)